jgi:uncharacterized protein (DUF302 family)
MVKTIQFTGVRISHDSLLDFDRVLSNIHAGIGDMTIRRIDELTAKASTVEAFERAVESCLGPSGFMLFATIDHGAWISKFGIPRRVLRFILGNPLIAITMIRRDLTAGLFAPVELLLTESEDHQKCSLTYVLPSSLIAVGEDRELLAAAKVLDAKLNALVIEAVSASALNADLE